MAPSYAGGFVAARTYPADFSPAFLAVGDFNNDGILDLAVANANSFASNYGNVSVLLGKGDGSFQPAPSYTVGADAFSVVVGDFNGDGHLDLAVAGYLDVEQTTPEVSILLGNGDGTFQAAHFYRTQGGSLAVGDLNGDGNLDLMTSGGSVLLGNGDGTFQAAPNFATGNSPSSVAVGDFNGDGIPDLAVTNGAVPYGTVTILLGNGDGTFQANGVSYAVGTVATSVVVGDFNNDGHLDLAVGNLNPNFPGVLSILLGNGDGTFQAVQNQSLNSAGGPLAFGDFNGDGILDLATGEGKILLGNGDGTFQLTHTYAIDTAPPVCVAVADFNGDGSLDLAVACSLDGAGNVSFVLGNGDGSFNVAPTYPAGYDPEFVAVGDLNGDGIPDLAVANGYGSDLGGRGHLSVLLGNGDGTFRAGSTVAAGLGNNFVAVADLNGDGKPDIIMTSFDAAIPRNSGTNASELRIFLGNGDGTFQGPIVYNTELGPNSVAVGDFNGDGIRDLAVACGGGFGQPGSTVTIMLGNGNGTFQAPQSYATGDTPRSVVAADFNADGTPDLAVANYHSNTVSVLLGNGDGTFQAAQNYAVGSGPYFVAIGDFNADGIPDLAVANNNEQTASILLGNGDGTFAANGIRYAVDPYPVAVAVGDFNRDGALDLAVTSYQSGTVSVLLGKGDGSFRATQSYAVGYLPWSVGMGDFNADSFPDLAVVNVNTNTATILLNATNWPP
jgi:hypothetical protein